MAAELGVGYISIIPETSKITPAITDAIGKSEKGADTVGKGIGSKIATGAGKALAVGAASIGAAAGGVLGVAFAKGFGRLTAIENAQSKLSGLGHSAEGVSKIMDNALASVKGTAYGLGEAASTSASLVAAGIKPGEELERRLKNVADTAAIAGANMGEIGTIFGSVAARGKLQGDDMLQLLSRGIPVLQLLSEETGKTSEEISKMVSDGKIDFNTFANAMEKGMGGAALKTGETVEGAMANLSSALGRAGAKMLDPFFKAAPGLLTGLTSVVDEATVALDPLVAKAGEKLAPVLANVGDVINTKLAPNIGPGIEKLSEHVTNIINAVTPVARDVGPSLLHLGGSIGTIAGQLSVTTWQVLGDVLIALKPVITDQIVPAIDRLAQFTAENPGLVKAFVAAWLGAKVIGTVAGPIGTVASAVTATGAAFRGAGLAGGILNLMGHAKSANPIMAALGRTAVGFGKVMLNVGNILKFIGPAITALSGPIGWAIGAIAAVTAGLVLFFTKTETGKRWWAELVEKFQEFGAWIGDVFAGLWDRITAAWDVSFNWVQEKIGWVTNLVIGLKDLFANGDFTVRLGEALGVDEDSAIVDALFNIREGFVLVFDVLKGYGDWLVGVFSGAWKFVTSVWQADFDWIAGKVGWVINLFTGLKDLFLKGDFTIRLGDALGVSEDSFIIDRLLALRDMAIGVLDAFKNKWTEAKDIVGGHISFLKGMWEGLASTISQRWHEEVDPIITLFKDKWNEASIVIGPFIQAIKDKWAEFTADLSAKYHEYVAPAIDVFKEAASQLWAKLGEFVSGLWEPVLKPALIALGAVLVGPVVLAFGAVVVAVGAVVGAIGGLAYAVISMPGWVQSAVEKVQAWFFDTKEKVSNWFSEMGNNITAVASAVVNAAFGGLQRGLDTLHGWFNNTVNAIGGTWDRIRELTAKPIRFVIDTVYNNGIRRAWNAVGKLVGLDELPEHKAGFATGGILPGYSPGRDIYTFVEPRTGMAIGLSGGEPVLRPEAGRVLGPDWVDGINAAARMGGTRGVQKFLGGFSGGGVIGSITNIVREKFPGMTITSTYRAGDSGYHGRGMAVDFSDGFDTTPGMQAAAKYFFDNYAVELAELIHYPLRGWQNIKHGRPLNYPAGTNAEHRNHVHVASEHPLAGGGGRGGILGVFDGVVGFIGDQVKKLWDEALEPIKGQIPEAPGIIGQLPLKALETMANKAWEFVTSKIPFGSDAGAYQGAVGAGVEQWRPLVEKVLKAKGLPLTLTDTTLRRMNQESGGNPRAINLWDSNAAKGTPSKGLMQTIDTTFQANKDPGYDDIWDPESNIRASINYTLRTYGSLPAGYNQPGGYATGGIIPNLRLYDSGGYIPHGGTALNLSGKPEPVLTNEQWKAVGGLVGEIQKLVPALDNLTRTLGMGPLGNRLDPLINAAAGWDKFTADLTTLLTGDLKARREVGLTWGGSWAAGAKSVQDAEKALAEVRKQVKDDSSGVTDAEKALAEAREELAKAEKDGGGISKESRRKLQDAEEALAKARESGKADKIADAEKRLARAREDAAAQVDKDAGKNADSIKNAMKKVEQAEDKLSDAREKAADRLEKVTEAENKVIQARLEVYGEIANALSTGVGQAVELANRLNGIGASIAKSFAEAREEVAKLQQQRVTEQISLLKAQREQRIAALDITRVRAQGRLDVINAEAELAEARRKAALLASTSVGALGLAIDRFRRTGIFAIGEVSASVIANSAEVRAAQWGVKEARIKALLEEQHAQLTAAEAGYKMAEASLAQAQTVGLLALATERLQQQAGSFYGMTQQGAQRAERGWGGIGGVIQGLLKTIAGGAAAAGAFATGNIPAAIAAGATALGSLKDTIYSGIHAWTNRKEVKESWDKMDWKAKLLSVLGIAGDAAIAGAGAHEIAAGRIETGKALLGVGPKLTDLTLGALFEHAKAKNENLESKYEEKRAALQREAEVKRAELQAKMAADLAKINANIGVTEAAQEIAKLQKEIAQASTKEQAIAANELAIIAAQKRDQLIEIGRRQAKELDEIKTALAPVVAEARQQARAVGVVGPRPINVDLTKGAAYSADQVENLLKTILGDTDAIQLRLRQLEKKETETSGLELVNNRRR